MFYHVDIHMFVSRVPIDSTIVWNVGNLSTRAFNEEINMDPTIISPCKVEHAIHGNSGDNLK